MRVLQSVPTSVAVAVIAEIRATAPSLLVAGIVATGLSVTALSARGQDAPADTLRREAPAGLLPQEAARADSVRGPRRHNAGGAFLRSVLIPGWGQATVGSPDRGGFYFAVESISLWMILKTSRTLGSARAIEAFRRAEAEARVIAAGETDPLEIEQLVDEDEVVVDAAELVAIRSQQKEDWLAFGLFFLFLGGADAFVAAHLADFPQPLEVAIRPLPDMGVEVAFSVRFDPFRPRRWTSQER